MNRGEWRFPFGKNKETIIELKMPIASAVEKGAPAFLRTMLISNLGSSMRPSGTPDGSRFGALSLELRWEAIIVSIQCPRRLLHDTS